MKQDIIGVGSFSKIRLIEVPKLNSEVCNSLRDHPDDENNPQLNGYFAIKQMKKTEVMRNKQTEHVRNESLIHYQTDHPFLTTLFYRFQDDRHLNLVMEYVQCGTVYNLIQKNGRLPNEVARFYAAQIVMAVQYLHGEHMIFRDLNPTNILLDRRLYIKLTDFGLSKVLNLDDPTARTWTLCGEPEYLAPEIIKSAGHAKEVDWWALGIIIHEMLAGYPPWYDKDAFVIYKKVLQEKTDEKTFFPRHMDDFAKELLKKLLTKEKKNRIGSSKAGAEDIKKHKWYRGLNWAALYNKNLEFPSTEPLYFTPVASGPVDTANASVQDYPVSSDEENTPQLDPERDATTFGGWDTITKVSDLAHRSGKSNH